MVTHPSTLAWEIPWTEETGRHDLATKQQQCSYIISCDLPKICWKENITFYYKQSNV